MTYLVDANILSEPTKHRPDAKVVAWLSANERDFVVDSVIRDFPLITTLVWRGETATTTVRARFQSPVPDGDEGDEFALRQARSGSRGAG